MRLAVYIRRLNQARHVEAAIREASARGHEVTLILDDQGEVGPKAGERARPEFVPARFAEWCRLAPQGSAAAAEPFDALLVAGGINLDWQRLPSSRIRIVVQGSVSDFLRLEPARWDLVCCWSAWWAEAWASVASAPDQSRIARICRPVGFPVADCAVSQLSGPPTVVYLPFAGGPRLVRARYAWWDEPRIVRALAAYCRTRGASLVVKSRAKTPVSAALRRVADEVIETDQPGEPTLWRLLTQVAVGRQGLLVHHMSTGVAEAAAAGVQSLGIMPYGWDWPSDDRVQVPDLLPHGGFYHWRGLSQLVRPDAARFLFSNDADLLAPPPGDSLAAYRSRFLGPRGAGLNIVKALEEATA